MTFWSAFFPLCFGIQALYWLALRKGFGSERRLPAGEAGSSLPISVIVAARDEEANLPALLDALAAQTHPQFEVIVVDDGSTDGTAVVVRAYIQRHPSIRLHRVTEPKYPRKKHALTEGIERARYELLAFTDADCRPGPGWLAALAARHGQQPAPTVLVGYGPYTRHPGLLNALIRYETFVTAFLTAGATGLGRSYMAVGRNLSYPAAIFRRIDGFTHSAASLSGDDDLLVQEVARRGAGEVHYLLDPETFVPSEPARTWRQWLRQKMRHTSAGRYYARSIKTHLALFQGTGIALWLAPLILGVPGTILLACRLAIQALSMRRAAILLHERSLFPVLPLLDACYALYNLVIAPLGLLKRPRRW